MKGRAAAVALLLCLARAAAADSFVEQQVLQGFFSPEGIENRSGLYGGELLERGKRPTLGEILPPENIATFRLLEETPERAVYAVTVETAERTREWSAFFVRSAGGSRLGAVKSLHLPPYLYERELPQLAARGAGRSSDEEVRYTQLQRLFAPAAQLKQLLVDAQAQFAKVAQLTESDKLDDARKAGASLALAEVRIFGEKKSEGELALLAAGNRGGGGTVPQVGTEIRLGSFFESAVGFLHLPQGVTPPPCSPQDYIQIEPAGIEGWYFFRNIAAAPPESVDATGSKKP